MGISQLAHVPAAAPEDTPRTWNVPSGIVTVASVALAAWLLARAFRGVDVAAVGRILRATGAAIVLPFAAYLVTMTVDSLGWRRLIAAAGARARLLPLVGLRISIEAIQLSLPWGSVISESLTPALLRRRLGVPLTEALAATGARKCLFALTQSVFLLVAAVVGARSVDAVARSLNVPALSLALVGVAGVLMLAGSSAAVVLARGALADRMRRGLARIGRLRGFLERRGSAFGRFDATAAHLFHPARLLAASPFVFGVWLAETLETWLLLLVLGVPVSFAEAIPIEASASVLRILGVGVPAGLGVQEIGYVAFIAATGVPDPVAHGAAFAAVKRAKEAFWMIVGYGLMGRWRA
jgi:glycosyltransferase 2 family protein